MDILLANPRGFCAGVDRAIAIVERALESYGAPIYVRHEVVHNRYVVDKLRADSSYTVLAHKAWEQNLGEQPVKIAITDGQEQFGQFPIEGVLSLQLGRFTDIDANFWINQFDANGSVIASEHLSQTDVRTKNNQLNYLDGGHLALLIKITSLTAKPPSAPPPDLQD